jgi:hypothetical protein
MSALEVVKIESWLEENGLYCPRAHGRISRAICASWRSGDPQLCGPCTTAQPKKEGREEMAHCRLCGREGKLHARGLCNRCYKRWWQEVKTEEESPQRAKARKQNPTPPVPQQGPARGHARRTLARLLMELARVVGGER